MSITIRLQSIKCLREVNESSPTEEPYVLVTSADLGSTIPGVPAPPNLEVFRYGVWNEVDAGEVRASDGPAFWGVDSAQHDIRNPDDVALIVSLMESDNADPRQYQTLVKTVATMSLTSSLGQTNNPTRVTKLLSDIRNALNGVDLPIPFALDDDHIATEQLKLDGADLIPFGIRERTITITNTEGAYELTFIIKRHGWRESELAGPGSASGSSGIAAVSRIPGSMELWWVGGNGSVEGAYWYDGQPWARYQIAGPGSASTSSGIAAVSRIPGSMELWWVGGNGSVEGAYWYDGQPWARYELANPGKASASGGIAAVSRIPGSMELWYVGGNGSINDAFWYG
ncbi:hypothetical protein [Corallococcus sp. AB030]|uniref:hypothetical protein n=1 Tax=Corallococcus sp. AB030 TaxID=2316716 RepID=UPI0011E5B962|nr:hypothetical protein [Corallococcus sp. AB030]